MPHLVTRISHPHYFLNSILCLPLPLILLIHLRANALSKGLDRNALLLLAAVPALFSLSVLNRRWDSIEALFESVFWVLELFNVVGLFFVRSNLNISAWWTLVYIFLWFLTSFLAPQPPYLGPSKVTSLDSQAFEEEIEMVAPPSTFVDDSLPISAATIKELPDYAALRKASKVYHVVLFHADWSTKSRELEITLGRLSHEYTSPTLQFHIITPETAPQKFYDLDLSTHSTAFDLPVIMLWFRGSIVDRLPEGKNEVSEKELQEKMARRKVKRTKWKKVDSESEGEESEDEREVERKVALARWRWKRTGDRRLARLHLKTKVERRCSRGSSDRSASPPPIWTATAMAHAQQASLLPQQHHPLPLPPHTIHRSPTHAQTHSHSPAAARPYSTPTTSVVVFSLAIILSSGFLIKMLQPKFKRAMAGSTSGSGTNAIASTSSSAGTAVGKGKKRKESVLKIIKEAQTAGLAASANMNSNANASTNGPTTGQGARSRPESVLSAGQQDSPSTSRGRSSVSAATTSGARDGQPGAGGTSRSSSGPLTSDGAFSSAPPILDLDGSKGRRVSSGASGIGKNKKGKGVAYQLQIPPSPSASTSTLAPLPSATSSSASGSRSSSPSRRKRPLMKDAQVHKGGPLTTEASVQTPVLPSPWFISSISPDYVYPPLPESPTGELTSYPLPPFSWSPPSPLFRDAIVQTSPRLLPTTRPKLVPYNLHASFQSTPTASRIPITSPPDSPSPRSKGESLPLVPPSPSASPTATSRSRKQQRKAAAASALATSKPINVVGLPKTSVGVKSRDSTGEVEGRSPSGQNGRGVGTMPLSILDSPESGSTSLPPSRRTSVVSIGKGKGKEKELGLGLGAPPQYSNGHRGSVMSNGATLMPSKVVGNGPSRHGAVPPPIPIPLPDAQGPHRRTSTQSSSSSSQQRHPHPAPSSVASSSSSSPYLSHLSVAMSPNSAPDRSDAYWRQGLRNERTGWDSDSQGVGLGVNVSTDERGRPTSHKSGDGRTWSQAAGGSERRESTSSRASSPTGTHLSNGGEGFSQNSELFSPPTSPDPTPASQPAVPFQSKASAAGQPWSSHTAGTQQNSSGPFSPKGHLVNGSSQQQPYNGNSFQSRPSSRQSSLSVPVTSPRDHQQQHQLQQQFQQQQQAYAFAHAQAQAQYHQAVAIQLHAQQVHASQQAHRQQRIQQEMLLQDQQRGGAAPTSSASEGGDVSASGSQTTPSRAVSGSMYQTPHAIPPGWPSVPPSPSTNNAYPPHMNGHFPNSNVGHPSSSPGTAAFPPHAYYTSNPSTPFLGQTSNYHLSASANGSLTASLNRQSTTKGRDSRRSSPRIGTDRSNGSGSGNKSPSSVVGESTGWKIKLRMAEIEADRNGKELEIARWRLAVLEEERVVTEVENQEALAALANRAKRAEARLKLLEEARQQDSSSASASGSASPVTRPSSILEGVEIASSRSPADDEARLASPPGVAVHPLAWLDLDSVTFSTHLPQSQSRSHFLTSPPIGRNNRRNSRNSSGADSAQFNGHRRRSINGRRRSTNSQSFGTVPPDNLDNHLDEDDDDFVIVLDSPMHKRRPKGPSRRSSFLQDDEGNFLDQSFDDDDVSNVDLDDDSESDDREHLDYTGFLPTFLNTPSSPSSNDHSTISANSTLESLSPVQGCVDIPSPLEFAWGASTTPSVLPQWKLRLAKALPLQGVWPVHLLNRPVTPSTSDGGRPGAFGSPVTAAALVAGRGNSSSSSTRLTRRSASDYATDTFAPHVMTGVDKTHKAGQLGNGVLVCALDTGVDYLNPILGGCFGSGCHVSVGYDLVGDNYDGSNSPVPDSDPYSACNSHGTHVSGIIGALANQYGFSGVAPEANLGMFRIFGCSGSVTDDVELQAYLMAMKAGCNVINMSLGGPTGYESVSPVERMIETAATQGIFTAVSAGNEGAEGLFYASDPASNRAGASVAAVNSLVLPALLATLPGVGTIPYLSITRFNASRNSYRVYFTSTDPNVVGDACSPLPASTPNLANYVVVVARGQCNFVVKYQNVVNAGGKYLIIYNNAAATSQVYVGFSFGNPGLDAVTSMRREDGLQLLNYYKSDSRLLIRFPDASIAQNVYDTLEGGLIADFSSYATTFDMYGVSFAAPGGNILSTFPLQDGGIGVDSGTSMSSPFVAGSAAVIMAARKSEQLTVSQIKGLLSSTTSLVRSTESSSSEFTNVASQGSGLIQVDLAVAAKTLVNPMQILLNDTAHLNGVQTITITNKNSVAMLYTFSNLAGQGLGLYDVSGDNLPSTSPPVVEGAATVTFNRVRVQLSPGASTGVLVTVTPPTYSAADAALYPFYSGWVVISGHPIGSSATETLRVPYFGLSGSLIDVPVMDTTDTVYGEGYSYPLLANTDIQLIHASYSLGDGPVLISRLAMGTPLYTVDLVLASTSFVGTIPTDNNAPAGTVTKRSMVRVNRRGERVLASSVATVGNFLTYTYSNRDALVSGDTYPYTDEENRFNGAYQKDGKTHTATVGVSYRLLLRVLKITGDPLYEDQYESWVSPSFTFTH
ncbi:hypothetical protein P7C70_g2106, partial [Phenoliferia sp. Uapishka_3]